MRPWRISLNSWYRSWFVWNSKTTSLPDTDGYPLRLSRDEERHCERSRNATDLGSVGDLPASRRHPKAAKDRERCEFDLGNAVEDAWLINADHLQQRRDPGEPMFRWWHPYHLEIRIKTIFERDQTRGSGICPSDVPDLDADVADVRKLWRSQRACRVPRGRLRGRTGSGPHWSEWCLECL